MAESGKQPRRSIVIAARLIALTIGLAGAEGVLWFGGYPNWWQVLGISRDDSQYAPDSELGWKNREGQFDLVDPGRNQLFHYTNWSQGRRATSSRQPVSDGHAPRVLFFGDSYVQGYGLSNEQTFAWMVQAKHPELAVFNFGTADYGTYQSYLAIEKQARKPGWVFYLFNDFHERRNVGDPDWLRILKPAPPGLFFPYADLAGGSEALARHQSNGAMVWQLSRWLRTAALVEDYFERLASFSRVRDKRRVTERILEKMDETVRSAGGKFTVILFDLTPEQRHDYRQFLASRGIHYIDCDHPEMTDKRFRLADGHPNEELNRLLAGWIEPLPMVREGNNERASSF